MAKIKNISSQVFGRLTVLYRADNIGKKTAWTCKCECGNAHTSTYERLANGQCTSCGCFNIEQLKERGTTHGMTQVAGYTSWVHARDRVVNPKNKYYSNYGGRGITMCDSWMESYENFYTDMGAKPSDNHSIDRIDNNKGYYKENCRWATRHEQNYNKRNTIKVYYDGEYYTIPEISRMFDIPIESVEWYIGRRKIDISELLKIKGLNFGDT